MPLVRGEKAAGNQKEQSQALLQFSSSLLLISLRTDKMDIPSELNNDGTKIDWEAFESIEAREYRKKLDAQKKEENNNDENTTDDDDDYGDYKSRTEEEEKMMNLDMKWNPITSDEVSLSNRGVVFIQSTL